MAQNQEWWANDPVAADPAKAPASQGGAIYIPPQRTPEQAASEARAQAGEARAQASAAREEARFQQEQAGSKPTEAQQKAATLVTRIAGGFQDIERVVSKAPEAQAPGLVETMRGNLSPVGILAPLSRGIAGADRRAVYDAQRDVLDALLTLGTGAAYSPEQLQAEMGGYFPQYGDTQDEIDLKNNRMRRLIESARENAGPLAPKIDAILEKFKMPTLGGDGVGPNVTVTPEQSIAAFGELTYDEKGKLVGAGYEGMAYNADGTPRGLAGSVSEDVLKQSASSFYQSAVNAVTGADQATPITESLPDWVNMPGINNLLSSSAWKTGLGTAFGGSPQEIAQIVQDNFPGTKVWQDEKGNYILRSAQDGKDYAIKPGFQISDIPRAGNIIGAGLLTGGSTPLGIAGREALAQTGIEAAQSGTGGTFNPSDIAIAGAMGGLGGKVSEAIPNVVNKMRRVPPAGGAPMPSAGGAAPEPVAPSSAPMPSGAADEPFAPITVRSNDAGAAGVSGEGIRVNRARELPVPVELAKFQRSRLFEEQQRARELAKNNEVGGPIRDLLKQQQEALRQNFDAFLDQTGSREWSNRREQGLVVDEALRTLSRRMNTKVKALYARAEKAGEMAEPVNMNGLADELNTLRAERTAAPVIKGLADELRVRDLATGSLEDGTLAMKRPLTLNEAEALRKKINRVAKENDPNDLRVAGELKGVIDGLTENAGGEAYKAARAARKEVGDKFERIGLVKRLVGFKPGTADRQVALENVVDTAILSGTTSLDNLRALKGVLDDAGPRGQRAWREMQGATIEAIRDRAYKSQTDETGQRVLYPSALEKAITDLDKSGKLDFVFGNKTAEMLRTMAEVSKDLFTAPPGSVNSSNTASGITNAIDTLVTFSLAGAPIPAGKVSAEFFKAMRTRGLRKEVQRLTELPKDAMQ